MSGLQIALIIVGIIIGLIIIGKVVPGLETVFKVLLFPIYKLVDLIKFIFKK